MKNKMLVILVIIALLFAALYFVVDYRDRSASEDNPFGKDKLDPATIDQLDDPNYDNQIIPSELDEKLANEEDITVYYYSPKCSFCIKTTPVLVDVTEEMDVDVKKFNLLEFENKAIQYTPTLIHYEDGKEVGRLVGEHSKDEFRNFFNEYVLDDE
ncbi:hypothetical protein JNUCC1_00384 [Lentibacillus sp. JNUCC-1]|uniref:thioredoxin family protein n=1 Tax=Lentibacillus sp. JNUCC-1 TaxID=2654513 RepID=UPI0012E90DDA|nr:thioredoxin family protein [Lentibacillus sp. JNUCC-1]MUV36581.1 hypothetical protein [Lentibacillus sp. JNUCC-1]